MKYLILGAITVSTYTEVEADSPEEAIGIAKERKAVISFNGSGYSPDEYFVIEDADGIPYNLRAEKFDKYE